MTDAKTDEAINDKQPTEASLPDQLRMLLIHDLAGQIIEMVSKKSPQQPAIADAGYLIRKAVTFDQELSGKLGFHNFIAELNRSLEQAQRRAWPNQMTLIVSGIRSQLLSFTNKENDNAR